MALTKEEHDSILKKIAESGDLTDDMLEDIKRLRDSYDEQIGMKAKMDNEAEDEGGRKWKEEYFELKRKYIDRFFQPDEAAAKRDFAEEKEETKEDVKKDGEKVSYEKLFEEREGD